MLQKIADFFGREWKRILILLIIAAAFQLLLYSFVYTIDPKLANKAFAKNGGLIVSAVKNTIEFTITYYVLIFVACLPLLRYRRAGRFFLTIGLLFAAKFAYVMIFEYNAVDFQAGVNSNSQGSNQRIAEFMVNNKFPAFCISVAVGYMFLLLTSFIVASIIDFNYRIKQQKDLEKQKSDAELSAIKYQINPHFLFNSLSFIYSKTVPLSEEVSNAVLLLSDIMRYALGKEEDAEGKVTLEKEITHMKNVIEINQMRFNNQLSIQYSEEITNHKARIIPLILITLVENAFKHGDLLDPANPLVVRTEADDKMIRFYITNKKKKGPKELSTGIGLNNVRQRLQLTYGDKQKFIVTDNDAYYSTTLKINL